MSFRQHVGFWEHYTFPIYFLCVILRLFRFSYLQQSCVSKIQTLLQ